MGRDGVKDERAGRMRKRAKANGAGKEWWRKLALPKRGKKDTLHSPAPLTKTQEITLEKRRAQLSKVVNAPRTSRPKHMSVGDWIPEINRAAIRKQQGNSLMSMGDYIDGTQHLYPEEALLLIDKGTLELRYHGQPLSLQFAWNLLFNVSNSFSIEQYLTYAHLRRAGYVVRRSTVETDLPVKFSCWRIGGFKRKDQSRPLFHVAVYNYSQLPPTLNSLTNFLNDNTIKKTRMKIALIDRGVVVLSDIANNATPLSDRFKKRYEENKNRSATTPVAPPSSMDTDDVQLEAGKGAIEVQD